MCFALVSHKVLKRGEKPPYCRFYATETRNLDPPSYFPNSFLEGILGNLLLVWARVPFPQRLSWVQGCNLLRVGRWGHCFHVVSLTGLFPRRLLSRPWRRERQQPCQARGFQCLGVQRR